jgi:hypothetical protein
MRREYSVQRGKHTPNRAASLVFPCSVEEGGRWKGVGKVIRGWSSERHFSGFFKRKKILHGNGT